MRRSIFGPRYLDARHRLICVIGVATLGCQHAEEKLISCVCNQRARVIRGSVFGAATDRLPLPAVPNVHLPSPTFQADVVGQPPVKFLPSLASVLSPGPRLENLLCLRSPVNRVAPPSFVSAE